jgi:DNA (cytosine-5)-methyltransferase 1
MDYGLACAGFEHAWFCESDAYCRSVLERRWPGVPIYEDVREVGTVTAPVDLVSGGFPCQPVSLVGRRRKAEDERWLWPEFLRVVRLLRPRYVLVENVPGLLTAGMGDVLGGLAESGYDAEWDCLPAAAFGAPHIRDRVFVLAYPRGARRREDPGGAPGDEGADAGRAAADDHELDGDGEGDRAGDVAYADREPRQRAGAGRGAKGAEPSHGGTRTLAHSYRQPPIWASVARPERAPWPPEPGVGRMAHGVPHRVDRLRVLGNGVVPQVAEWLGRRILDYEQERVAA